jgi:plastocyanin
VNPSRRSLLATAGSVFLLAGCSSSPTSTTTSPTTTSPGGGGVTPTGVGTGTGAGTSGAVSGSTITIQNFAFSPAALTVAPGSTVTVTNKDSTAHTVTSDANPKAFDTGHIQASATTTFTAPAKPGSYAYSCTIHPFMHGTLTVQ